MQLKTVEIEGKTYAEVQDGKPVYDDGGKDIPFDAPGAIAALERVNKEAKGHRISRQEAEDRLKAFEGIEDPDAARKALETMQNLDQKQLVDAGEVEKVKAAAIKALEEKYKPVEERAQALERQLHEERIGGSFLRSKFISDKIAVPGDMVRATFGNHFSLEDGKIVAKDRRGNLIYSKASPGEIASFDEALEQLVDASPYRDQILKGRGQSGSGAPPSGAGGGNGKTMTRAEFDALSRSNPAEAAKAVTSGGVQVVDA